MVFEAIDFQYQWIARLNLFRKIAQYSVETSFNLAMGGKRLPPHRQRPTMKNVGHGMRSGYFNLWKDQLDGQYRKYNPFTVR